MEIRPIQGPDEAKACADWMARLEPWVTLGRSHEDALKILSDPEREVYVARVDGDLAGFLVLQMRGAFVGYIQSVGILPHWRNRGLGTRLLAFAEERIFPDAPNIFICVSSFNTGAERLYARLGYEVVGTLRDYIVAGHGEVLMRKTMGPLAEFRKG